MILFAGIFFSALEDLENVGSQENSLKALNLAEGCLEEALNELKKDIEYEGNESFDINGFECNVHAIDSTGFFSTILTEADFSGYKKKIKAEVSTRRHPELEIINWKEVE